MRKSLLTAGLAAITSLTGSFALAQDAPPLNAVDPAAEIRRHEDRERVIREREEPRVDIRSETPTPIAPQRLPTQEIPCFDIQKIELHGDDAARFQWILDNLAGASGDDSAIGKCVGAQGISVLLKRAQDVVIAKGFVTTRVLAQPQDLKTGTLVLSVIPGRIRAIRFASDTTSRAHSWNAVPAEPGDILNLRDIEQGLENFLRVPTAKAHINIEPAEGADAKPGYSDLVIDYTQEQLFRLTLSADDSGTEGTGKYQGGITFNADSLFTINDLFYVTATHDMGGGEEGARGTRGNIVHYSVPYGYWNIGTTLRNNYYFQTVAGATQDFTYRGKSHNAEVKLSRLVYRDARRKTTIALGAFQRRSNNYIDDTEVDVQRRIVGGWSAGIGHREFIGGATIDANLGYKRGTGAFGSIASPEEAFDEGTSRLAVVTADINVNVPFKLAEQQLRYNGCLRVQDNHTPLTPQDRFAIGGRYTVRGFDGESSLSAERGWLLRNELGLALGKSGQELYLGLDYAEVGGPSSDLLVGKHLAGGVIGLRGQFWKLQYDFFVGGPISKPEFFRTDGTTTGFNLNLSF